MWTATSRILVQEQRRSAVTPALTDMSAFAAAEQRACWSPLMTGHVVDGSAIDTAVEHAPVISSMCSEFLASDVGLGARRDRRN
jgi:hypothetical protein